MLTVVEGWMLINLFYLQSLTEIHYKIHYNLPFSFDILYKQDAKLFDTLSLKPFYVFVWKTKRWYLTFAYFVWYFLMFESDFFLPLFQNCGEHTSYKGL